MFKDKLLKWIPDHFKERHYPAYIEAIGAVLDNLEEMSNNLSDQTYIQRASTEFLLKHGEERSLKKVNYGTPLLPSFETDLDFRNRITRIKYNRTENNIKENIYSVLGITEVKVIPDFEIAELIADGFFGGDPTERDKRDSLITDQTKYDFSTYGNFGPLDLKIRHNCFSVLLETPERNPLSFFDSDFYYDSEAFLDTKVKTFDEITAKIIKTLIKLKSPAGSGFRLLINKFTAPQIGDEASQEKDLNSI